MSMNRRSFFKNSIFAAIFSVVIPKTFAKTTSSPKTVEIPPSTPILGGSILDNIKKDVEKVLSRYAGETNDVVTRQNASYSVSDMLSTKYHQQRLIYNYSVVINETNNSPRVIDSNKMACDVYLQFNNSVGYSILNCVVTC